MSPIFKIAITVLATSILLAANSRAGETDPYTGIFIRETRSIKAKRERQDKIGGVPEEILKLQSLERIPPPSLDSAVEFALKAAEKAVLSLIDTNFHTGRRLIVPDDYKTIQKAIDAADSRDVVVVRPGTYYEMIVMKEGVKLISDSTSGGEDLIAVEGMRMKLPRRALRTIIDGSKGEVSSHGVIDFNEGLGRNTIVDGFTIQNLPMQNHHIPGHPHAVNMRGASAVIMNCLVQKNGSTGIGSHVIYADQDSEMPKRDFRWANVKHWAWGVIYHNIVRQNLGLGIGFNHFSAPYVLGNEVARNDDTELGTPPTSPGMGAQHGAAPTIIGNIIHDNPGGGILSYIGEAQGAHPVDRPSHPTIMRNVVYSNGRQNPAIACDGAGTEQMPVRIVGNYIYDAGAVGIGVSMQAVAIVEYNIVSGSADPGISINAATALNLNHNTVTKADAPGFLITKNAQVLEMVGNTAFWNQGPRFMLVEGARIIRRREP